MYKFGALGTFSHYLKYTKLNDRPSGIADTKKAAELAKTQGNTQVLNLALQFLQHWGASQ